MVTVRGDRAAAAAETFLVRLSSTSATLEDGARTTALGTILNDDNEQLAAEGRFVFTTTEDFLEGRRSQTAAVQNELRLDLGSSGFFPFVNVAASERGSLIRIDVRTGVVVGEYNTAPGCCGDSIYYMGHNPSRTTVDRLGNVWVANRNEKSFVTRPGEAPEADGFGDTDRDHRGRDSRQQGGRERPPWIVGQPWVFQPDPQGEYLQGPFDYSTAVDRDGDGLIRTSRGLGHILRWTNAGEADSLGGVSTAEDELIINYTRTVGAGTRTVAVDQNNDIWVGGWEDFDHEKISGETGLPLPGTRFNLNAGGYGGLVDRNGVLWSSRGGEGTLRFVPLAGLGQTFNDRGNYGLTFDPRTGHIWHSSHAAAGGSGGLMLYELDAFGEIVNSYPQPFNAQGVAVDSQGHVWVVQARDDPNREQRVWHLAPDPQNPGRHIPVGTIGGMYGITGAAVDVNGKIWAPGAGSSWAGVPPLAYRIDPQAGPIGAGGYPLGAIDLQVPLGAGAGPYNYSDMTGFVSWNAFAQGTWTHTVDSEHLDNFWHSLLVDATLPEGSSLELDVRAANDRGVLDTLPYTRIQSGDFLSGVTGRFLDVRVTLRAQTWDLLPSVQELVINSIQARPRISVQSPADGTDLAAGTPTVIVGQAAAGHPAVPLAAVLVNGTPVDALDAAGNFFTQATILPGQNAFEFTAVDVAGATATTTVTLDGVQQNPAHVPFVPRAELAAFQPAYHRTSFVERTNVLYAGVAGHQHRPLRGRRPAVHRDHESQRSDRPRPDARRHFRRRYPVLRFQRTAGRPAVRSGRNDDRCPRWRSTTPTACRSPMIWCWSPAITIPRPSRRFPSCPWIWGRPTSTRPRRSTRTATR